MDKKGFNANRKRAILYQRGRWEDLCNWRLEVECETFDSRRVQPRSRAKRRTERENSYNLGQVQNVALKDIIGKTTNNKP
jgi:hypothetical protein